MANSDESRNKLVSEQMAGLTVDNQPDPYISYTSQSPHPYQELSIPIQEEIIHKNATFDRTYRVLNKMAHEQLQIHNAKNQHLHPRPQHVTPITSCNQEWRQELLQPEPSRLPANVLKTSHFSSRTIEVAPKNSQGFMNPSLYPQEHPQILPHNSRNHFLNSKTASESIDNSPQTEDYESPSWLIFELEHSVEVLESMELSTIIMFIQSINKKIAEDITPLQNRLLAANLTKLEKERIAKLPYRIWNICIELTNHYPTGYDSEIDEFGFLAIVLDELIKGCCIDAAKSVQSDPSSCKKDEGIFFEDSTEVIGIPSSSETYNDAKIISSNAENILRPDEQSIPVCGDRNVEEEGNTPFLCDGVRLFSVLEEYLLTRQQKEEEKRHQRNTRKLQNLLLTGNYFHGFSVSFLASIYGLLHACRPLLVIEETRLKGKYVEARERKIFIFDPGGSSLIDVKWMKMAGDTWIQP